LSALGTDTICRTGHANYPPRVWLPAVPDGNGDMYGRRLTGGRDVVERSYEIHVRGEIPSDALSEFEGMTTFVEPAETVLSGVVEDQAALQGVIARIHALGLELVEVRRLPNATTTPPVPPSGQAHR
jgi:hypothetical protein